MPMLGLDAKRHVKYSTPTTGGIEFVFPQNIKTTQ
jgi:hypothetical protein